MAKRIRERVSQFSDSARADLNPLTIDLISNKEALINGCKGIIEYDENSVRVNCGKMIISFEGSELSIRALSVEEITVNGEIIKIEFSSC